MTRVGPQAPDGLSWRLILYKRTRELSFHMPDLMEMGCLSSGVCWRLITDFRSCFLGPLSLSSTTPPSLSSVPFPHHLSSWPHRSATLDSPIPCTSSLYSFSLTSPPPPCLLSFPQSWSQKSSSFTSQRWWRCIIMSLPTLSNRSSATGVT